MGRRAAIGNRMENKFWVELERIESLEIGT